MEKRTVLYSICKNEEDHILEWYESFKFVDVIVVADTGSTDSSLSLLKECQKKHKHFLTVIYPQDFYSFADARNFALDSARSYLKEYPDFEKYEWIFMCFDIDERLDPQGLEIIKKEYNPELQLFTIPMFFTLPTAEDVEEVKANPLKIQSHTSRIHTSNPNWHWRDWLHEELNYKDLIPRENQNWYTFHTYCIHIGSKNKEKNENKGTFYRNILENWCNAEPKDTTPKIHLVHFFSLNFFSYSLDSERCNSFHKMEQLVQEMVDLATQNRNDPYKLADALDGLETIINLNKKWTNSKAQILGWRKQQVELIRGSLSKKYRTPFIELAEDLVEQAQELIIQSLNLQLDSISYYPFQEKMEYLENKNLYKKLLYLSLFFGNTDKIREYKALCNFFPGAYID